MSKLFIVLLLHFGLISQVQMEYSNKQLCSLLELKSNANISDIFIASCLSPKYADKLVNFLILTNQVPRNIIDQELVTQILLSVCEFCDWFAVDFILSNFYNSSDDLTVFQEELICTCLKKACKNQYHAPDLIKNLIVSPNKFGLTKIGCGCWLTFACMYLNLDLVIYLKNYILNNNIIRDTQKRSLLHYCCYNLEHGIKICEWLINNFDKYNQIIDETDAYNLTPLHLACQHADLEFVKFLSEKPVYSELFEKHHNSLLQFAAKNVQNGYEIIEYLVNVKNLGRFINSFNRSGAHAGRCFNIACRWQKEETLRFLTEHDAEVNSSCLYYACRNPEGYDNLKYILLDNHYIRLDELIDLTFFQEALAIFNLDSLYNLLLNKFLFPYLLKFISQNTVFQSLEIKTRYMFFLKKFTDCEVRRSKFYKLKNFLLRRKDIDVQWFKSQILKIADALEDQKQGYSLYQEIVNYKELIPNFCLGSLFLNALYENYVRYKIYQKCIMCSSEPIIKFEDNNIFPLFCINDFLRISMNNHFDMSSIFSVEETYDNPKEQLLNAFYFLNTEMFKIRAHCIDDDIVKESIKKIVADPWAIKLLKFFKIIS